MICKEDSYGVFKIQSVEKDSPLFYAYFLCLLGGRENGIILYMW